MTNSIHNVLFAGPNRGLRASRGRIAASAAALLVLLSLAGGARAAETTFRYLPPGGTAPGAVSLRGSLNGWGETPMTRGDDGVWSVTLDVPPGEIQYKYFIDGQWPPDMSSGPGGAPLDPDAEAYADDGYGGQNAVRRIGGAAPAALREDRKPAPPLAEGVARVHYHRPDGAYAGWGLHAWMDAAVPVEWTSPLPPTGEDPFGLYWDVKLAPDAERVGFIVHKGDDKDPGPDMFLDLAEGREVWIVSGSTTLHRTSPDVSALAFGDLSRLRAHWLDRATVAWAGHAAEGDVVRLSASPDASLKLTADGVAGGESFVLTRVPGGLSPELRARYPHLASLSAWTLPAAATARAAELLRGQLAVSVSGPDGKLRDATGVQIPGVLDDLFATDAPLGPRWESGTPALSVWAPTARSVKLLLYAQSGDAEPEHTVLMSESNGVWSATGSPAWKGMYYLYEVTVYAPETLAIEVNRVTDPYSRSLSINSARSQLVDLDDPALKPPGWAATAKPPLAAREDAVVYELHVRDFSAMDPETPEPYRGTFMAFTVESAATRHLRELAAAGLTHVHLLPAFDIATVDEVKANWKDPGDLSGYPPDSDAQQAAVDRIRGADGYNWGYDPWHFGVPEGSYATDPDGSRRVVEFRAMVEALADMGLRTVMDVVYNHTHASGQDPVSVFDRIVPGYYHRLNVDGFVETSTCCQNTASEHAMMERFIVDDVLHWVRDYKIDGFRFDLMGHHMKRNMERLRAALDALTPEKDGVDGRSILVYGEGWDFGEVGQGKRGVNATQTNLAGTGVATFNDRLRDAVRGGSPFTDRREQGFATGLFTAPNAQGWGGESDRRKLLEQTDRIRIGMAGNLRDYRFVSNTGAETTGGAYQGTGYAADPEECVNYVSAHDNETFYDKIAYAAPETATLSERARMQSLALAVVALGQGIPFFHAGSEMLRSKSMDADSYDSGDWFNRLDFTGETDNFGVGLPLAGKNADRWPIMRPVLARADLRADATTIAAVTHRFESLLAVRGSSPLFRLRTAAEIQRRVRFHNTGPDQTAGLIVMSLSDRFAGETPLDDTWSLLVVLLNASPDPQTFRHHRLIGERFVLHPALADGDDPVAKAASFDAATGTFTVPGRTAVVFGVRR